LRDERLRERGVAIGVDFDIMFDAHWGMLRKKMVSSLLNTLEKPEFAFPTRYCPTEKRVVA
jgi:hypothetical protein